MEEATSRYWRGRNPSSQKWLKCTTCSSSKVSWDSIQGVTWRNGTSGSRKSPPNNKRTILLATHEKRHWTFCHTCLQLRKAKKTSCWIKGTNGKHPKFCTVWSCVDRLCPLRKEQLWIWVHSCNCRPFHQVRPTENKSARTAAGKLYNDFILRFGFPARILHDQGGEFVNKLFPKRFMH